MRLVVRYVDCSACGFLSQTESMLDEYTVLTSAVTKNEVRPTLMEVEHIPNRQMHFASSAYLQPLADAPGVDGVEDSRLDWRRESLFCPIADALHLGFGHESHALRRLVASDKPSLLRSGAHILLLGNLPAVRRRKDDLHGRPQRAPDLRTVGVHGRDVRLELLAHVAEVVRKNFVDAGAVRERRENEALDHGEVGRTEMKLPPAPQRGSARTRTRRRRDIPFCLGPLFVFCVNENVVILGLCTEGARGAVGIVEDDGRDLGIRQSLGTPVSRRARACYNCWPASATA
jgi:hypothetical protein